MTVRAPVKATIVVSVGITSPNVLYAPVTIGKVARAQFSGLAPNATYRYEVTIRRAQQQAKLTGSFTTGSRPVSPKGSTSGSAVTLDGQPFFPVMTWAQCPSDVAANLAVGVNTFLSDCGDDQKMCGALAGRAYFAGSSEGPTASLPEEIGVYQPDEAEVREPASALPDASGVLSFQTFTDHFSPQEDQLPLGPDGYQPYIAKARVVGFDLYPLAERCPAHDGTYGKGLDAVYDEQHDLVDIAGGRPTFQWIETNAIEFYCGADPVSAQALVAESWLAVAGGATGIGYFTHLFLDSGSNWRHFDVSDANQGAMREVTSAFAELAPALTTTPLFGSTPWSSPLRVGYRVYNGAVYVIAVNSSSQPVSQRIIVRALTQPKGVRAGRVGFTYGEGQRRVQATNGATITDRYDGYGVHVYVFPA